jgi:hypothetical protein
VANNKNCAGAMPFLRDLKIEKATAADGTVLEGVTIDTDNDRILFEKLLSSDNFKDR